MKSLERVQSIRGGRKLTKNRKFRRDNLPQRKKSIIFAE